MSRALTWLAIVALAAAATVHAGEVSDTLSRPVETERGKAAAAAEQAGGEVLRMRWKLGGFIGTLAGLFIPNNGDALLTLVPGGGEHVIIQMLITAHKSKGDYFLYGAEVDEDSGAAASVWSSYSFRGDQEDREESIDEPDLIDFASVIYYLRRNRLAGTTRMTIWNEGKTYPVEVEPLGPGTRKVSGTKIDVEGYSIHGVKVPDLDFFKEKFFLYFATDERRTLVELIGKRGLINVRIYLVDSNKLDLT